MQKIILHHSILLPGIQAEFGLSLKENLTILNPVWIDNEKLGRWNKDVPKQLTFFVDTPEGLQIPRGYMRHLINDMKKKGMEFEIVDRRRRLPDVSLNFNGSLKPFQEKACSEVLKKHFSVLTAPTGSGKTVMMLFIIAQRKQPSLIVVHSKELGQQWLDRIDQFLGIPSCDVGYIGAGKCRVGEKITVAMVQTLYKYTQDVIPHIGNLVVDECHRTPSRTFHEAVSPFDSYYMTGLSATPFRRDRLSKLIFWHLGDQAHQVDKKDLEYRGDILKAEIIFRATSFSSLTDPKHQYGRLMDELINDMTRNEMIVNDIATEAKSSPGVCLVLSDRKNHCRIMQTLLMNIYGLEAELLTGDLKENERADIIERLGRNQISILIATSQLLGEGFDSDKLTSLFLIYPIRFKGRLLQYLGRILRPSQGKKARVFDYVDINIPVLEAGANARRHVYFEDQP